MKDDFGNSLIKNLNKKMKEEMAFMIVDEDPVTDVKTFISTGCTALDTIISNSEIGGAPVGKIMEITGMEGTGKSLMAMHMMADTQKNGGLAVYIDSEHSLDTDFATRIGLDVKNNFIHVFPSCVEDVFTTINVISEELKKDEEEAKKNKTDPRYKFVIIVWDSIAATPTKLDRDAENPDPSSSIGVKARTLGKNIPMLLSTAWKKNIAFVFINQLRMKIGTMPGQDPFDAPGGKSIPYYSSVRIRLSSIGKLKISSTDSTVVGIQTRAKVIKNRFGPPHRTVDFPIYFTHGIDNEESIIDILEKNGKIKKINKGRNGSFFQFDGDTEEMKKREMKNRMITDSVTKQKAINLLHGCLIKNLEDPRKLELELDENTEDLNA